jgi:hypothetical protein
LELVSAISFDELLDVAVVFENQQTKQLEIMSAVRMALQVKDQEPILRLLKLQPQHQPCSRLECFLRLYVNISNAHLPNEDIPNEDISKIDISNEDIPNEDISNRAISRIGQYLE